MVTFAPPVLVVNVKLWVSNFCTIAKQSYIAPLALERLLLMSVHKLTKRGDAWCPISETLSSAAWTASATAVYLSCENVFGVSEKVERDKQM